MNNDIMVLVKACENILHISKPTNLILKTRNKGKSKVLAGYCDSYIRKNKVVGHKIVIHVDTVINSGYNINDVIAHEFVHAAMIEHGLFDQDYHHDKTFQKMCAILKKYLVNLGFDIGELYNSKVDID